MDKQTERKITGQGARVHRFLRHRGASEDQAEDITQETLLAALRQYDAFEGRSSLPTWILAIARFKYLSYLRARKLVQLDDEMPVPAEMVDKADPERLLMSEQMRERVREAVSSLPAHHRAAINAVYFQGRSVAEAAAESDIPPSTLKTRLFYARASLAEALSAHL